MLEQEHKCENIARQQKYKFVRLSIKLANSQWIYVDELFASPGWVHDGEADYVGQLIRACKIYINFCPECGENLSKTEEGKLPLRVSEEFFKAQTAPHRRHQCMKLEEYNKKYADFGSSKDSNGLWIIEENKFDKVWSLERHAYIIEQLVPQKKGQIEADKVGKLRFEFGFSIVYCPFCGEYLSDDRLPR
jgi:hypothetical protein